MAAAIFRKSNYIILFLWIDISLIRENEKYAAGFLRTRFYRLAYPWVEKNQDTYKETLGRSPVGGYSVSRKGKEYLGVVLFSTLQHGSVWGKKILIGNPVIKRTGTTPSSTAALFFDLCQGLGRSPLPATLWLLVPLPVQVWLWLSPFSVHCRCLSA